MTTKIIVGGGKNNRIMLQDSEILYYWISDWVNIKNKNTELVIREMINEFLETGETSGVYALALLGDEKYYLSINIKKEK